MSNVKTCSSSIGFNGLLTVLFIGLKLTHVIDWSWWWVLSPLWIGLALLAVGFFLTLLFMSAIAIWEFFRK